MDLIDHGGGEDIPLYPLKRGDRLQNHEWVPLHFHRLLGSDFATDAVAEGRRADLGTALILWAEAMRQDPAGTLPIEDRRLYQLARFPSVDDWLVAKSGALHGFFPVHVSDGDGGHVTRLAHGLLTDEVVKMWRRQRGRADGRAENNKSQARRRIREKLQQLLPTKRARDVYLQQQHVEAIRIWLEGAGLTITEDNVRTAHERETGGGVITPFSGG